MFIIQDNCLYKSLIRGNCCMHAVPNNTNGCQNDEYLAPLDLVVSGDALAGILAGNVPSKRKQKHTHTHVK
jgi:hypothetical protein